jgi:hypothetical protein
MPLLIDDIRRRFNNPDNLIPAATQVEDSEVDAERLRFSLFLEGLEEVQGKSVIRATNIYQWCLWETREHGFDLDSLECCFPPFEMAWVEWGGMPMGGSDGRMGVLVRSVRKQDEWEMAMEFALLVGDRLGMPAWSLVCRIADDGKWTGLCVKDSKGETFDIRDKLDQDEIHAYSATAITVLQTFCFMNCTGVRQTVDEPSMTPLQKKWDRNSSKEGHVPKPLVSFTTVEIGKFFAQRRNGKSQPTGAHNREHWTRGHVKHYPGLLLFGRVKLERPGVWCPSFKSGRAKGEVKRAEYDVTVPERSINLGQDAAAA